MKKTLRIGSRRSRLALIQSEQIKRLIEAGGEYACEIVTMDTLGDRITDRALPAIGDKGLFTKELEERLLHGDIDLAVHSLKDLPTDLPDGLELCAVPPREDPRDAFLSIKGYDIYSLPDGGRIATGSLRRRAQVARLRPDVLIEDLRGNVPTRIEKLRSMDYDGIVLACAGLKRLGMLEHVVALFDPEVMVPAAGQGALGVECREDLSEFSELFGLLTDEKTLLEVSAERDLLGRLGGSCQVPMGINASIDGHRIVMVAFVADPDPGGGRFIKEIVEGKLSDREKLIDLLYGRMEDRGALAIVEEHGKNAP